MADVTELCLISFERFTIGPEIDRFWTPIGLAVFELKNGLTTERIKISIFERDLSVDGEIDIATVAEKLRAGTDYDLHNDVANCVKELAQFGWLSPGTKVAFAEECRPEYEAVLSVTEWKNGPLAKDYFARFPPFFGGIDGDFSDAIAGPLFDAVVREEGLYSDAWYNALICRIYFSTALDCNINDVANLGRMLEQKLWKQRHEKNAMDGEAAQTHRKRGAQSNTNRKSRRRAYMFGKALEWELQLNPKFNLAGSDLAKAKLLLAEGLRESPDLFTRGAKSISTDTIKQDYEDIKSQVFQGLKEKRLRGSV